MTSDELTRAPITTIIFDVDDTLYDVGTGFTAHRNGEGAQGFMVKNLNFPTMEAAKVVRDEYFEKYHSTAKALEMAEKDGRLPACNRKESLNNGKIFHAKDLAEYWATNLDFSILNGPYEELRDTMSSIPLNTIGFSNGPRKYVIRVLRELGLWELFGEDKLFAVDDVLPFCKPEKEAFDVIFSKLNIRPENCIMVEDSMKNTRMAKKLGMKTILVLGKGRKSDKLDSTSLSKAALAAEATKPGDAPVENDPSVDVSIETCYEIKDAIASILSNVQ
jgi:putative hydrolase of the HAD superfamily